MRNLIFSASALAALAVASPALAQDDDASFTGPRVEGVVGWDRVEAGGGVGEASDGVAFGAAVGYDYQTGGLVLGAEAELTGASTKQTGTDVLVPGDSYRIKAGRDIYVGGRIGAVVSPNAMVYAKGGYTNAGVSTRYVSGGTTTDADDELEGWRAGGGVEVKVGPRVYVKGEYRYSHYGEIAGTAVDIDRHQVVGGVGVRF